MAEKGYSAFNRELQINLLVLAISDCKKSCKNAFGCATSTPLQAGIGKFDVYLKAGLQSGPTEFYSGNWSSFYAVW